MNQPRHSAALVLGVFLAVALVVIGTTAAVRAGGPRSSAPAAAPHAYLHSEAAAQPAAHQAEGLTTAIPDTSGAASDPTLRTAPGVLVARGKGFTVEQVALAHPMRVNVQQSRMLVKSVYRIVVTAGPFQVRDMPNVVSLNGRPLAVGLESVNLQRLTAFTFDRTILTQGAHLTVSYGLANPTSTTWSSTVEVVR